MLPSFRFLTDYIFLKISRRICVLSTDFMWLDEMLVTVNIVTRGDRVGTVTFVKNYL